MVYSVMRILCLLPFMLTWYLSKSLLVGGTELQEQTTLLTINKELRVPVWNANNSDYCSWEGVTFGHHSLVEKLNLSNHNLGGDVTSISRLKALKWLDLSNNNFHGLVPPAFGNLPDLEFLDLSSNKFEGSIPPELGGLRSLKTLNLSNNMLVGEMPKELQGLESLQDFQIFNNLLSGMIPSWVGNLTSVRDFSAYENQFSGGIPGTLGFISELKILNLHSNHLEGPIPGSIFYPGKLEVLILTQNNLSGNLPEEIGNCQTLISVRIGNNNLVGNIPKGVGNLTNLAYFEADNNNLYGELVSEFSVCSNLVFLNLASNGFTGTIPPEFGQLMNLQVLILSGNRLFGDIPKSILQCENLNMLDISNNRLNGTIPNEICNIFQLQNLLLGQNSIRGVIPHEIGRCGKLVELQLGSNNLTGTIPSEIGYLMNLEIALNLSFNHLHGPLPPELGRLIKLASMDVSNNNLTGYIPDSLNGMTGLIKVNLSNNQLSGSIPELGPFQRNPASSYLGNKGLCGEQLNTRCEDDHSHYKPTKYRYHHELSYETIVTIFGSFFAACMSLTAVVFLIRDIQEQVANDAVIEGDETNNKLSIISASVFVDNLRQAVDLGAVVEATLNESNKLSSGSFSAVYKAFMPSGIVLLVRKLVSMDMTIMHHQNKIIGELQRLSKLCHENLMQPIGYVIYNECVLLIHQYLPNGALAQLLHESGKQPGYEPDWPSRLSIAMGVAEGLAFLHRLAIIHLDISSTNILLDAKLKPLIGDIEISKLLDPTKGNASIIPYVGSFGYIPPEYAYTMRVAEPGNVYSFGVILLEMLTTRRAVDEAFGEGMNLVRWVHGAAARGETPEQILDARLSTVSHAWRKEMLAALKLALLCTHYKPAKRPKMMNLVEMLRKIRNN
ncbi:Leucine-rich repeat receptor-like tyrosine-protein kinase PXC3, partial [Mucuna pruriens]